ncbi:hypothetical protein HMPREF2998_00465 [Corynebacterium sp. HMSC065A05]|uniref:hypothetical protein n=1 Tax=Corynebacterium sp. HMSC065A05 TaxID=1739502 RepID=UPI0008A5675D|nr:hypothetical protein [Corynebacterium sp. HMSC065A05]OFP15992.1 hypothetical protein HMPREF2998_00465 [Corynebacterium sp. HMSC065A05]
MHLGEIDGAQLVTIFVAIVSALGGYAGVRAKASADRKASEPTSWQSLITEMKAYFQERLETQQEQLESQGARISTLEERLSAHMDYAAWLEGLGLPKPPFLPFDEWRQRR